VRKHAEHPAELAQLSGARLMVCAVLDEGQRFAEARVKQLTGRNALSARFMRRDWFTSIPVVGSSRISSSSPATPCDYSALICRQPGGPAFWQRIRVLPFNRMVPPQRQDKELGDCLAEDAPAILAWIIAGAAAYHLPPRVRLRVPLAGRGPDRLHPVAQQPAGPLRGRYLVGGRRGHERGHGVLGWRLCSFTGPGLAQRTPSGIGPGVQ
jgi:hypothetical protein